MMKFNRHALHNLEFSLKREWFESNSKGCMASQSILGINTRNHHGLFILRKENKSDLLHYLANLEETIVINGFSYNISSAQYKDQIYPEGYKFLTEVKIQTHPEFIFNIHGLRVKKEIIIPSDEKAIIFKYSLGNMSPNMRINFVLKPFFTFKYLNEIKRKDATMAGDAYDEEDKILYKPYSESDGIYLSLGNGQFVSSPLWYYNFYHALNTRAPKAEDYYNPGFYEVKVKNEKEIYFIVSENGIPSSKAPALFEKELANRKNRLLSVKDYDLSNPIIPGYLLHTNNDEFILESPWHHYVDFLSLFLMLPALSGLIPLVKYQKIIDSIIHIKTNDLLPDIYKYSNSNRLFETPLPNLFFIIFSSRQMQFFPKGVPKLQIERELLHGLLQPFLKNKFQRLQLKSNGWLKYRKNEKPYIWYFPFSIRHINCSVELSEVFLNILWYNALEVFLEHYSDKIPFKYGKLLKYKNALKERLKNISIKSDEHLFLTAIILALPFRPLSSVEYEKQWHHVKKSTMVFGPTIQSKEENKSFSLPILYFLSLFHFLHDQVKGTDIVENIEKILLPLTNHAFDGCIGHFSQMFEVKNDVWLKSGNPQSGLNLAYYQFWTKLTKLYDSGIK